MTDFPVPAGAVQPPKRRARHVAGPAVSATFTLPKELVDGLEREADRRVIGRNVLLAKVLEVALPRLADQQVEITL